MISAQEKRDALEAIEQSVVGNVRDFAKILNTPYDLEKGSDSELYGKLAILGSFDLEDEVNLKLNQAFESKVAELVIDTLAIESKLKDKNSSLSKDDSDRLSRVSMITSIISENLMGSGLTVKDDRDGSRDKVLYVNRYTGPEASYRELDNVPKDELITESVIQEKFEKMREDIFNATTKAASLGLFNGADTSKGRGSSFNRT
ncbi:MAG: hypothetical protein AAGA02_11520 [Bacteroidota bacterium]